MSKKLDDILQILPLIREGERTWQSLPNQQRKKLTFPYFPWLMQIPHFAKLFRQFEPEFQIGLVSFLYKETRW